MTSRPHINLKTKLASALCQMLRPDESGKLVPVIHPDDAKHMTEDEVLRVYDFDHYPIPRSQGGPDAHWNLVPLPRAEHREKTSKRDIPQIAKTKRLMRVHEDFQRLVLAKPCGQKRERKSRIPSRPFRQSERTR